MKFLFLALVSLALASTAALAKDCSYCDKMEALKAEFAKVEPDPMDEDTIDHQDELLGETEDLIRLIAKKKVGDEDLRRIVEILAVAVPFDYAESLGESLYATYRPFVDRLIGEVRRQEKAKILSAEQARNIIISIGIGEDKVENGAK